MMRSFWVFWIVEQVVEEESREVVMKFRPTFAVEKKATTKQIEEGTRQHTPKSLHLCHTKSVAIASASTGLAKENSSLKQVECN